MSKPKIKIKDTKEAVDVSRVAGSLATGIIAAHGSRCGLVIARLVHEKVYANFKRMENKYGKS